MQQTPHARAETAAREAAPKRDPQRAERAIKPRIARRRAEEKGGDRRVVPDSRRSRRLPSAIRSEGSEPLNPGSRAAVLRRREGTRLSSPTDDEVGGSQARSAASGAS